MITKVLLKLISPAVILWLDCNSTDYNLRQYFRIAAGIDKERIVEMTWTGKIQFGNIKKAYK